MDRRRAPGMHRAGPAAWPGSGRSLSPMSTRDELVELRAQLCAIVAAIESGDLPAEVDQVEQLRGAVSVLSVLTDAEGVSLPSQ